MNFKILKLIFCGFLCSTSLFADTLTLDECYNKARENYPIIKQKSNFAKINELKKDNFTTAYYPEITLLGQAQYQSDVTKINISFPIPNFKINVPEQYKDQYKIGLNVNQIIWDGGITSSQKEIEDAQLQSNLQSVEVELYNLRSRINDLFFGTLILNSSLEVLNKSRDNLTEKLNQINVRVESGVVLESNSKILQAEIYSLEQNIDELKYNRKALLETLGELINQKIDESAQLIVPDFKAIDAKLSRPELKSFEQNKVTLEKTKELVDAKYYPKFSAFLQAMYGRPGLNMFDNTFQPFYIAGLKASWNLWNWNQSGREKEIIEKQKENLDATEQTFIKNINTASKKFLNDIEKLEKTIELDNKIIALKLDISNNSSTQMMNGVITATDYLTEYTAQVNAQLTLIRHHTELMQAKANYRTLLGN